MGVLLLLKHVSRLAPPLQAGNTNLIQSDGKGKSLLFLQPSEVGFLRHLKEARVPLVEFEFPAKRIFNVQSQLEKLINQNYYLNKAKSPFPLLILAED